MAKRNSVMADKAKGSGSENVEAGDHQPAHATGQRGAYPRFCSPRPTTRPSASIAMVRRAARTGCMPTPTRTTSSWCCRARRSSSISNGPLPVLRKHQALMLPKGCFYSFSNEGTEPLVHAALRRHGEELERRPARSQGQADSRPRQGARFQAAERSSKTHSSNSHGRSASLSTISAAQAATCRGRSAARGKQRIRVGGRTADVERARDRARRRAPAARDP